MTARKLPKSLASIAPLAYVVSIFEEGRPVESGLKHFHGCFLRSEMATISIFMVVAENPLLFSFGHTSSNYLVSTIFEQKWLLPIKRVDLHEELFLVLCLPLRWDFSCC